ncbi:MAG TPA: hypothetical protein VKA69_06430 [Desulfobacteria bacterium]|nr:hypothetical protein [Desulfobacteria bacterium]
MLPTENGIAPCLIHIDVDGRWFHKGVEMVRRDFVQAFFRQMELDHAGRYIIFWGGKLCYVDVEDTAFVVRGVSHLTEKGHNGAEFKISLSDDTEEELMPDTLYLGKENVLYCKVKKGAFPARFNRAAYYQLAAHVEADGEAYVLPANGKKFKIESKDSKDTSKD